MSGYCLLACRRDLFVLGGEVAMAFQSNKSFQGEEVMETVVVYEVTYQLTNKPLSRLFSVIISFFIFYFLFFTWEGLDAGCNVLVLYNTYGVCMSVLYCIAYRLSLMFLF